ncbi:MAG: lysylphosphatidylglycerol synthase transmembrane domain-containing protein [Phototrophicaceae bacterium]
MKIQRLLLVILGMLVSILFMWSAFYNLDPRQVWLGIQTANRQLLLGGMLLYYVAMMLIAVRWQFVLRSLAPLRWADLFPLVAIGYMGNNIYPFRAGEVLRIVLLRRNHAIPYVQATTATLVERVFDGVVMLTFIVIPIAFLPTLPPEVRWVAQLTAPVFLVCLGGFFLFAARPMWLRGLVAWGVRPLSPRIQARLLAISEEVILGLESLRSLPNLLGVIFFSYASWLVEAGVYYVVAVAFDLSLDYGVVLAMVGGVNLAGLIPSAPGMVGVFERFIQLVLVAVGISHEIAIAYAITAHVAIWLPPTLIGFVFLGQQGLKLSTITHADQLKEQIE